MPMKERQNLRVGPGERVTERLAGSAFGKAVMEAGSGEITAREFNIFANKVTIALTAPEFKRADREAILNNLSDPENGTKWGLRLRSSIKGLSSGAAVYAMAKMESRDPGIIKQVERVGSVLSGLTTTQTNKLLDQIIKDPRCDVFSVVATLQATAGRSEETKVA